MLFVTIYFLFRLLAQPFRCATDGSLPFSQDAVAAFIIDINEIIHRI